MKKVFSLVLILAVKFSSGQLLTYNVDQTDKIWQGSMLASTLDNLVQAENTVEQIRNAQIGRAHV